MSPERAPFPGVQPPITTSWVLKCLTFTQVPGRWPGRYGLSRRLATTPSRPWSTAAPKHVGSGRVDEGGGRGPAGPGEVQGLEPGAAFVVGELQGRAPVEVEDVEDHVADGHGVGQAPGPGGIGDVHPLLEQPKARSAPIVEGHDLPVNNGRVRCQGIPEAPEFRDS